MFSIMERRSITKKDGKWNMVPLALRLERAGLPTVQVRQGTHSTNVFCLLEAAFCRDAHLLRVTVGFYCARQNWRWPCQFVHILTIRVS
mmetsp:Transcript_46643/g.123794  ORF Transcript_46643/g.123794 Transcript_46643/m.123794 type:complete len:89 (+) Transcript_46643:830-1096(+)